MIGHPRAIRMVSEEIAGHSAKDYPRYGCKCDKYIAATQRVARGFRARRVASRLSALYEHPIEFPQFKHL
jgi:hypothetical protein